MLGFFDKILAVLLVDEDGARQINRLMGLRPDITV